MAVEYSALLRICRCIPLPAPTAASSAKTGVGAVQQDAPLCPPIGSRPRCPLFKKRSTWLQSWHLSADCCRWSGYAVAALQTPPPLIAKRLMMSDKGFFTDGPRGVTRGQSTCFPCTMACGESFNTDLEHRSGEAMSEIRAQECTLLGAIRVHLLRHPA